MPLACDLSPSHAVPPGLSQLPGDAGASDGGRQTQQKPPCHVCRVPSVTAQPWPRRGGSCDQEGQICHKREKRSGPAGGSHQPSSADVGQTPD